MKKVLIPLVLISSFVVGMFIGTIATITYGSWETIKGFQQVRL